MLRLKIILLLVLICVPCYGFETPMMNSQPEQMKFSSGDDGPFRALKPVFFVDLTNDGKLMPTGPYQASDVVFKRTENFLFDRWAEVDPSGVSITRAENTITFTGISRGGNLEGVYAPTGEFFYQANDWTVRFSFKMTSLENVLSFAVPFVLTTAPTEDLKDLLDNTRDAIYVYWYNNSLRLASMLNGAVTTDNIVASTVGTTYYCNVSKVGSLLTLSIYLDESYTQLKDSISIINTSTDDFTHIQAFSTYTDGAVSDGKTISGVIGDYQLSTATYERNGKVYTADAGQPRFENEGLRHESYGTNYILVDTPNSSTWTTSGCAIVTDGTLGLSGTLAAGVTGTAVNQAHGTSPSAAYIQPRLIANTLYTFSYDVKAGTTDYVIAYLQFHAPGGVAGIHTALYEADLSDGSTLTIAGTSSYGIDELSDDWWRMRITAGVPSGTTRIVGQVFPCANDAGKLFFIADTDDVLFYLDNAQLEEGGAATSRIPTSGVTGYRGTETYYPQWTLQATTGVSDVFTQHVIGGVTISPSRGTIVVDWTPRMDAKFGEAGAYGVYPILRTANTVYGPISMQTVTSSNIWKGFGADDTGGTNQALGPQDVALTLGETIRLALVFGDGKMRMGRKLSGSWSWGTEVNYSGNMKMQAGVNMYLGYYTEGATARMPFSVKELAIFDRKMTTTEIESNF